MNWDPAISRKINVAFEADDVAKFVRMLRKQPQYIRNEDGTDLWMWRAAQNGKLHIIQAIVGLGLSVNTPKDLADPDNPFNQVEGPILQAASQGHLEVVQWLLDQVAIINFTVNDKPRCLPLQFASTNGHLNVVQLLVKHGADVKSSFNGRSAIDQAETYGHQEVADYLRSISS